MSSSSRQERPLHWIGSAKTDVDLIHERLKMARNDYEVRYGKKD